MAHPDLEGYKNGLNNLEEDAYPVVQEIKKLTLRARKAMGDPATPPDTYTLSNIVVELAIANQRLSERVTFAGYIKREAKNFYDLVREEHKSRLVRGYTDDEGKTVEAIGVGLADSEKIKLSQEEAEHANHAEYFFDQLNYLYKSTNVTLDAIRTKISYEKSNERHS